VVDSICYFVVGAEAGETSFTAQPQPCLEGREAKRAWAVARHIPRCHVSVRPTLTYFYSPPLKRWNRSLSVVLLKVAWVFKVGAESLDGGSYEICGSSYQSIP